MPGLPELPVAVGYGEHGQTDGQPDAYGQAEIAQTHRGAKKTAPAVRGGVRTEAMYYEESD